MNPEFLKFYNEFGLKHPEWLPNEADKLTLEIFWTAGLICGVDKANDALKEAPSESDSISTESAEVRDSM
jgi:hypothetical protein